MGVVVTVDEGLDVASWAVAAGTLELSQNQHFFVYFTAISPEVAIGAQFVNEFFFAGPAIGAIF
jgi:hypothetical protein